MKIEDGFDIYALCGFGHKSHDSKVKGFSMKP